MTLVAVMVVACTGETAFDDAPVTASPVVVTDVRGRTVTLPAGPPKLAIDDGRYFLALSILLDDPVAPVVGWPHDVNRLGEGPYARIAERAPEIAELGRVPSSAASFSVEQTLAVNPTVAVFSLGRGPTDEQLAQLERAGVVSVFVDFFMDPLEHVDRSLEILGTLVDAQQRAEDFVAFRTVRRDFIRQTLEEKGPGEPSVFLETHAGMSPECCSSPGKGNVGVYIDFVGGRNIGADVLPGPVGRLSLEYVLEQDPSVYVATGGPHLAVRGGLVLGDGYDGPTAADALERIVERPGFEHLTAVQGGRTHGLSHHLLNSPLDIVAVELLAKWVHPALFADLDPAATLESIRREYPTLALEGTYWMTLRTTAQGQPAAPTIRNPS